MTFDKQSKPVEWPSSRCCSHRITGCDVIYNVQGDLKRLLRSGSVPLTAVQRLSVCYEASLALSQLCAEHLVHADIAARNFLVTRSLSVKLSSVAAARGVDAGDYCELAGRLVPLRWLAPESALAGSYTAASDVWAYAIFVTEVGLATSSLSL